MFVSIFAYGHESLVITKRVRSQVQAPEIRFLRRIKGVTLFNKMRSSKIRTSLNIELFFSKLNDLSLDGLAMNAERLRKDSSCKLYWPKQMGEDQLDDLEPDGPITLRVLNGIAGDFNPAK